MKIFFLLIWITLSGQIYGAIQQSRVICYYDSRSLMREGMGKLTVTDLEPALQFCSHLIYGWTCINSGTYKLISCDESFDLDKGKGHFRVITTLKTRYPQLKILLGVGGGNDFLNTEAAKDGESNKYMELLESSTARVSFVNSAYELLKTYNFDGLDLGWEFPRNKAKKIRSSLGSFWHKVKSSLGATSSPIDEKSNEHKEEFTALIRDLRNAFRLDGYLLTASILPNSNVSQHYDVPAIINNLDFVTLGAYDFQTPDRNPKEADFPAPIFEPTSQPRHPENNVNWQVQFWLRNRAPATKICVGIPTYGRAWRLLPDVTETGVPPIAELDGGAPAGPQTQQSGLYSWPEICAKLPNPSNTHLKGEHGPLRRVTDPSKRFGHYAYRLPDTDGNFGLWIGYDDPESAANKASFVKSNNLGGVGIFDVSLDDFRGTCSGEKYPILRAIKYRL